MKVLPTVLLSIAAFTLALPGSTDGQKTTTNKAVALKSMRVGSEFSDCSDCPAMVVVPRGRFRMGSPDSKRAVYNHEGPNHAISIAYPLAIAKFPITRNQWVAFVSATGHDPARCLGWDAKQQKPLITQFDWQSPDAPKFGDYPMVCIDWRAASAYADWLSRNTGRKYRLLSESEYEYANRAGGTTLYPWGDSESEACTHANVLDLDSDAAKVSSGTMVFQCHDGFSGISPVGKFPPNAFGLYDMVGNVSEWTADCWNDTYDGAPKDGSAWISGDCSKRVTRGGSSTLTPAEERSASRFGMSAEGPGLSDWGFRVAASE